MHNGFLAQLLDLIEDAMQSDDLATLRERTACLRNLCDSLHASELPLKRETLQSSLHQIAQAKTAARARHYLRRLQKAFTVTAVGAVNDLNLNRWKEYEEIWTDSLWMIEKRDQSGAHEGGYWGNFVPDIPRQLMWRYTRQGDWVLDGFAGSGTTLIECRRQGRHGIGIELQSSVAEQARTRIEQEPNPHQTLYELVVGDSRTVDLREVLQQHGISHAQLLMLHPPYHDIISFSDHPSDLSNAPSVEQFLELFRGVVANLTPYLEPKRYMGLVIGDKYQRGEWIPLGFQCMQVAQSQGYRLKSIVVKNFEQTRGKRSQEGLWRYRALAGGFYLFKHEYVMIFQKWDD